MGDRGQEEVRQAEIGRGSGSAAALAAHPAAKAWKRLGVGVSALESVEEVTSLKGERSTKSMLYRLSGAGVEGSSAIAKRAPRSGMLVERIVYEEILPLLPVSRLAYYGFLEEEQGDFCWLFLQDAGGEEYSEDDPAHRALAAEWLGALHAGTSTLDIAKRLPPIGPERYLSYLRTGRQRILENLKNPRLSNDVRLLETIVRHCDALSSRWTEIERLCEGLPRCMVHGDFIDKNVRVVSVGNRPSLRVMDWEAAGWGVPAEDLAGLDVEWYWSHVRHRWTHLSVDMVRRLRSLGDLVRCLAWIEAVSPGLAEECSEWTPGAVADLSVYETELIRARRALGLL